MINLSQRMVALGTAKSEIREAFAFAQARAAAVGPEQVDDFSIGNPSVPAPDTVKELVHQLMDSVDPVKLHGYTPAQGEASVRQALADDLNRRYGTAYTADHFYLTAGAAGALCCALSALGCPGDQFLTFAPYFPEYKVFVESAGAQLVAVPARLEDFQIDFAALEAALSPQVKGVIINSPNNPTGVVYSQETIRRLAQMLGEKSRAYGHPIWLISDEPYREIVYQTAPLPWVPDFYDNTLVCYSYSKSLSLPGQRIGYVLVPPRRRRRTWYTRPSAGRDGPWAMSAPPASSSWWWPGVPVRRRTWRCTGATGTSSWMRCGPWDTPAPSRRGPSTSSPGPWSPMRRPFVSGPGSMT